MTGRLKQVSYAMLYPTPALTSDDARVLDEIDAMRLDLRHAVTATPARWNAGLTKFLTAEAIAASNSIEGFRVSTVDVDDLIEGEHDVDVSEENLAETIAYQHMMTYIQTLHDAPDFAYSKGLLNALHWMLQGHRHSWQKPAGQWRKGPVYVTDTRDPSIAVWALACSSTPNGICATCCIGSMSSSQSAERRARQLHRRPPASAECPADRGLLNARRPCTNPYPRGVTPTRTMAILGSTWLPFMGFTDERM